MFKYGTETMLDDRTLTDLREELNMDVVIGGTDVAQLHAAILDGNRSDHLPSFGFSTHAIKEAAKQH
jgi:NifB/MoaA-like Fe-S oxidoreductase